MTDFAVRLRRVRLKDGADVHVIHSDRKDPDEENWRGKLVGNARTIADFATDECPLAGFVIVGLFADGTSSVSYRYDPKSPNIIPRALLPAWVAELIRRDMVTSVEAQDTFNTMFEWVD